jgi:hypothetical protein
VLHLPTGKSSSPVPPIDIAVNTWNREPSNFEGDLPIASASSTAEDSHLYEAIDGRLWFFPEIPNGWSPDVADQNPWFAVDLRHPTRVDRAEVYFFSDGKQYQPPASYRLEMLSAGAWKEVPAQHRSPAAPLANGANEITFPTVSAQQFRIVLASQTKPARLRLVEFELIAAPSAP